MNEIVHPIPYYASNLRKQQANYRMIKYEKAKLLISLHIRYGIHRHQKKQQTE